MKNFNMSCRIFLFCFLFGCFPQPKEYKIVNSNERIEVQFGRKMSLALLDSIRQVVAERGVQLEFSTVKYDGSLLTELEFQIKAGVHTGAAATHFIYNGKPFGFRVTNPGSAAANMIVGDLPVK